MTGESSARKAPRDREVTERDGRFAAAIFATAIFTTAHRPHAEVRGVRSDRFANLEATAELPATFSAAAPEK